MLIVQKYGGSSLATADRIRHVAGRIARERAAGERLVVVVSAMGDTTDDLLALAAQITPDPDPRELDVLLATGEHMSGTLVAMALHAMGIPAISLTGPQAGIRTDTRHGRARIANVDPARLVRELDAGRVVIVAGFQGATGEGFLESDVTTLGRGGSDTTAVALAARLGADRCEILTDVDGIYTADPRVVPEARLLPVIGYEEMLELAQQGAQVMQTRAVELGWVNGVVIAVRSTFSDHPGTRIREDPLVEQRNKVRGLATDRHVAKVTLVGVPDRPGVAHAVFAPLAEAGINVDMIVQNVGHAGTTDLSFTIPSVDLARAQRLLDEIRRELGAAEVTTDRDVAKVSIVGAGIQNAPGYAARMFGTLAEAGINIEMISTSEIRITCIIAEADVEAAAQALHRAFALERPETVEPGAAGRGRRGRRRVTAPVRFAAGALRGGRLHAAGGGRLAGRRDPGSGRGDGRRTDAGPRPDRSQSWQAPPGAALLVTCGFRPRGLPLAQAWRIAAIASLALAESAEAQGLPDGTIGLKWPNDLVSDGPEGEPLKLAGVLGEVAAAADGTVDTCLVGLGVNVDWRAADLPAGPGIADDQPARAGPSAGRPGRGPGGLP